MLDHAYHTVRDTLQTKVDGSLVGGDGSLNLLKSLPPHWPLAKLTLPLKFGVQRLDRLVAGYLMELMATHSNVSLCRKRIHLLTSIGLDKNSSCGNLSMHKYRLFESQCNKPLNNIMQISWVNKRRSYFMAQLQTQP